jgi:predicted HNH restriction endonuclease
MRHTINIMKAKWICHILRRNRLLKPVVEGNREGNRRRGMRRKQLRDDHQERRRCWYLRAESLVCTLCKTSLETGYGPVARQTAQ